jgi:beta-galactosidase
MSSSPSAGPAQFARRTALRALALGAGALAHRQVGLAATDAPAGAAESDAWLFGPLDGRSPDAVSDGELSTVTPPHTVADLPHRNWDPSAWERTWLYRKHFDLPTSPGTRHFLRFEGAATTTSVHVNGHPVGSRAGGYLPFEHEITALTGEHNTADVVVDGRFDPTAPPNHAPGTSSDSVDFWQPAGLYREVSVVQRPSEHIADVFAQPVDVLSPSRRRLDVQCTLDLGRACAAPRIDVALREGGTTVATTTSAPGPLPPGRHVIPLRVDGLGGISLWDTENPHLYEVVTSLTTEHGVDEHRVRTGFRDIRFDRSGFWLNGRRLHLFGLNRHQLYPFAGMAMPERAQRRDAEILRHDLNCVMVRCSHYPPHPAFLDACDELGLLVWEEPPGWQHVGGPAWRANAELDLRAMIERDRNHPSVVLWAARRNEVPDEPEFQARGERIAKALDGSRPTTGAVRDNAHTTPRFLHDVFGYNDYGHRTGRDGERRPVLTRPREDHPYLVSEAVGTLSGPARAYRRTDPPAVRQGQALAHAEVHDQARADPRHSGLLGWSAVDYPSGNGNAVDGIKATGVLDLFRIPKPGAAFYRSQVDPHRRAVIEPSFAWEPGAEPGARAALWSNLDRLDLFVDGTHHQTLFPDRDEFPNLPHPPFFADLTGTRGHSELRVDGLLGDDLVLTRTFSSDRTHDRLDLTADDPELRADGRDATRAAFRAVDRYGADRLDVRGEVVLSLQGPATLIGSPRFPLGSNGGAGAVWLRTLPGATGTIRLTAEHPALGRALISVRARAPGARP